MKSRLGLIGAVVIAAAVAVSAQGRGGGAWTTVGGDAQRTSFVRADPKISLAAMQSPGFQFLWKRKLDNDRLTQPLLLPNIIAYKGFKALAFVGSASGQVYSIDYDLNRMFWQQKLATSAPKAAACSSGLPVLTKSTPLTPPVGRGGGGGGGRGRGATGPQIANGRGGNDNVFAISTGGMVHVMNPQIGTDQVPPVKLLPPNANVAGSILVDTTLYAATTGNCSGVANGVWSVDLASEAKAVQSYDTKGATIAGTVPPAFGTDGTLYIATGAGKSEVANAVVSLDQKTLTQKDWFATTTPFTSNPVVFQYKNKDLIVAANKDGRLYVLDSASLGGTDHKTPLHKSSQVSAALEDPSGLASWLDSAGTRWIVASVGGPLQAETKVAMANGTVTAGTLVAFTVVDQNDAPTLQPQWTSRDLASPVTPVVVNGVVFALASGEAKGRGRASNAVLYALDAATGKELWTSGTTITSPVRGVGPSAGDSQVYVAASDGTLYVFGMPMER
ncbi:MAG TPA: PQQ-binding-like beta-propeller repeat protein [Vicinamibacterales bacterium]|nr:PQQ-binding-like beta-propeller repeat protein [Vicinamibacterales bacterium]